MAVTTVYSYNQLCWYFTEEVQRCTVAQIITKAGSNLGDRMQEVSIRGIDCLLVRSSTFPLLAHSCPRFKIRKLDDNVQKLRNCRCRAHIRKVHRCSIEPK